MTNCSICFEPFTSPVSLPCGHVFCQECIRRTVDAVKSNSMNHFCPTCRESYSILTLDLKLVPPYLRPHIHPPLRKVFIDNDTSAPSSSGSTAPGPSTALGRASAEANALRQHCATWRQRAESHAMGNAALLVLARAAKDCALRMRAERDAERSQCVLLKRKLAELMPESELLESDSDPSTTATGMQPEPQGGRGRVVPRAGLPVFLAQLHCKPAERFYDNPADMTTSRLGPPLKRRKETPLVPVLALPDALSRKASPRADSACDSIFVRSAPDSGVPGAQ
ncbi:hypothetical protein C8R46DRAFT_1356610 [Mycena filopes]|nr:hypothetical protein C8R46DRAFT_1356610 [Mycena filopes]